MDPLKILLVGATGFIGGTIFQELQESTFGPNANIQLTIAVRQPSQAEIFSNKGFDTALISGLDDADGLENAARDHDIVINAATGQHFGAPKALLRGLGKRKEQTGRDCHFIHLSGTTNIAVPAITPSPYQLQTFSDADDDIYGYEKSRIEKEPYAQRVTDVVVIDEGHRFASKTYIIMPPTVYGNGTGMFKKQSHQIPTLIRSAIKVGYSEYIGSGEAELGHVHVTDLARLFVLLVAKVSAGETAPSGQQGIYFANTGTHRWVDVAGVIAKVGFELGVLKSAVPRSISLEEGGQKFADGDVGFAEACFASNSSSIPQKAFTLGWKPVNTEADFQASIKTTVEEVYRRAV
ncbi:NAD dependent epimerase/dehydratase [Aspergillus steynii IBT 23096]|uniref:NAD dependent epimerase/dehydratase n=1 Tax=Aspergillus steynii IBT 23096 TaxID=1392250 RepID=A0A2I2GAN1_9EURO|nr:NAD dependent epimerase/dehydratase [Aspergillus steynii IBT 23096]PLB49935.1 NAD dependent epimerase/dehydratase [Aspergillus steynii IBT 23096]